MTLAPFQSWQPLSIIDIPDMMLFGLEVNSTLLQAGKMGGNERKWERYRKIQTRRQSKMSRNVRRSEKSNRLSHVSGCARENPADTLGKFAHLSVVIGDAIIPVNTHH
jgi:hypothetical protein